MSPDYFINIAPFFIFIVIIFSTYFFATNKIPMENTAIAAIVSLTAYFGIFLHKPVVIISSFLNTTILAIISILVIGKAISCTGIINQIVNRLAKIQNTTIIIFSLILSAYFISGFMNNTPIVIIIISLLPLIKEHSNIQNSKVTMPIAFAASLGGMLTVLGSSTNIIIQNKLEDLGITINVFDFFLPGLFVSFAGIIYVLLLTKILPEKKIKQQTERRFLFVLKDSDNKQSIFSSITKKAMLNILYNKKFNSSIIVEEIVIKHGSQLVNQDISSDIVFKKLNIIGIASEEKRISPGKKIIITHKTEETAQNSISVKESTEYILSSKNAIRVFIVFFGIIFLSAFSGLPLVFNAFAGIGILLLTKAINLKQFFSAIDVKVFLMISYAFCVSTAMSEVNLLQIIADHLYNIVHEFNLIIIVAILFIIITLLNEVISNNAVGLIFTPIVIDLANKIQVEPKVFIYTLIFAANSAFLTPFGYQTNLIVMQQGGYKFLDYFKYGSPLTLVILISYLIFVYLFYL